MICSIPLAVPPVITSASNSTVLENTQHTTRCSATGDPAPSIEWAFEGRVLPSTGGVLTFGTISREDGGVYTCTASNAAGTASEQVYIDVQCKIPSQRELCLNVRTLFRFARDSPASGKHQHSSREHGQFQLCCHWQPSSDNHVAV